jgi:type II secretory ATPase GspE/PulE/Tfp pilus assembly ATPase PilB-like protein
MKNLVPVGCNLRDRFRATERAEITSLVEFNSSMKRMIKTNEALENYKNFIRVSKKSEMTNIVLRKISDLEK